MSWLQAIALLVVGGCFVATLIYAMATLREGRTWRTLYIISYLGFIALQMKDCYDGVENDLEALISAGFAVLGTVACGIYIRDEGWYGDLIGRSPRNPDE